MLPLLHRRFGSSGRFWDRGASLFLFPFLLSLLLCLFTACQSLPRPFWPDWTVGLWGIAPTPTPLPITTKLRFATWSSSVQVDDHFRRRLTLYQETAPDTQVELLLLPDYSTRLRTLLESNTPPDVIHINAFALPDLVQRALLMPLPESLVARAELSPLLQGMGEVDGKTYCIPHETQTLALLYNRTLFDAAQLAYPTADWNWETLRTAAQQLTDASAGRYGLVLSADFSRWLPFLYGAGGSVTDPDQTTMTINRPEALTALQFYTNLVLDGMAAPPATMGNRWSGESLAQGHAAMAIEGNWIIPYLAEQAPTLSYGVAPLPTGPVDRATLVFANCYAIAANTPEREAAANLIAFLTNAESQRSWLPVTAALPARTDLYDAWLLAYPTQTAFGEGLAYAYPWRFGDTFQPVVAQMNDAIQRIYGGFILADSALIEAETIGNEKLQK